MFQFRLRSVFILVISLVLALGMLATAFLMSRMQSLDQQIAAADQMEKKVDAQFERLAGKAEQLNVVLNAISQNELFRKPIDPADPEQKQAIEFELTKQRLFHPDIVSLHLIEVADEQKRQVFPNGKWNHLCFCSYEFFNMTSYNDQPVKDVIATPMQIAWSPVLSPYFYHAKPQLSLLYDQPSDSFTLTKTVQPYGKSHVRYLLQMEIRSKFLASLLPQDNEIVNWSIRDRNGKPVFHNPSRIGAMADQIESLEPGQWKIGEETVYYRTALIQTNGWKVTAFYKIKPAAANGMTRLIVAGIPLMIVFVGLIALAVWWFCRMVTGPLHRRLNPVASPLKKSGKVSAGPSWGRKRPADEKRVAAKPVDTGPLKPSRIVEIAQLQSRLESFAKMESNVLEQLKNQGRQTMAIKDLFDYVGLGVVTFFEDRIIHADHSGEAIYVYRSTFVSRDFVDVTFQEDHEFIRTLIHEVFSQEAADQKALYLSLLPKETKLAGHIYELSYKMITKEDRPACMVIFHNVTEARELAKKLDSETKGMKMIVKAVQFRNDVLATIDSYRKLVMVDIPVRLESGDDVFDLYDVLFRQVHTFKGTFGQLYFVSIVNFLHQLEDRMNELADSDFDLDALSALLDPQAMLNALSADEQVLREALGDEYFYTPAETMVDEAKMNALEARMLNMVPVSSQAEVRAAFVELRAKPLRSILEPYRAFISDLADELEKQVEPLRISGGYFSVDPVRFAPWSQSLIHVFRNMMDHGIETPDGRLEAGKPEAGFIICEIEDDDDHFVLRLSDDGKGINREAVLAKAVAKGLCSPEQAAVMSDREMVEFIFADDFSTKEEVTKLSGRGVGMSAVKAEVLMLGGSLDVTFESGRGTQFAFRLPKKTETNVAMIRRENGKQDVIVTAHEMMETI